MKVNSILIDKLKNEGLLNHLAFFIYIKGLNTNSVVYNYTQDKFAAELKLGKSTIRKYVNYYLDNGWAEIKYGHLILGKISRIGGKTKKSLYEVRGKSVKEIKDNLYLCLFKHKTEQTKWYTKTCDDLKKLNKPSEKRKRIKALHKRYDHFREKVSKNFGATHVMTEFKVSIVKIKKWFKCSVGKAHQIIMRLVKDGKLQLIDAGFKFVGKCSGIGSQVPKNGFVSKKGYVIIPRCNRYWVKEKVKCV